MSDLSALGRFYTPEVNGCESFLADAHPRYVVKGRIQSKYSNYQNFEPHSGGMNEVAISKVVTGRRPLRENEAWAWAKALDLPFTYLMRWFGRSRGAR
jgi:hypothetical protein